MSRRLWITSDGTDRPGAALVDEGDRVRLSTRNRDGTKRDNGGRDGDSEEHTVSGS
jgi:hypothetical protein